MKKLILNFLLMSCFVCNYLYAQNELQSSELPSWINKTTSTKNEQKAVGTGASFEEAYSVGLSALLANVELIGEEGSLYTLLQEEDSLFVVDIKNYLLQYAMKSSFFTVKEQYENDTATWVLATISKSNLKNFADSAKIQAIEVGYDCLNRSRMSVKYGDLLGAVASYAKGLNAVSCMMFKQLIPAGSEEDVAIALYNGYLTVLDSLEFSISRTSCPMVKGEDLPIDVIFSSQRNGVPTYSLPIKVWTDDSTSELTVAKKTDNQGHLTIHVSKAPNSDLSAVKCAIDKDAFAKVAETFVTDRFMAMLDLKAANQVKYDLVAFDPNVFVYIDVPAADTATYHEVLSGLISKKGYIEVPTRESADLIFSAIESGKQTEPVVAEDYKLVSYVTSLQLILSSAETQEKLLEYIVPDFKIIQPAVKTIDNIRTKAIKEMLKKVDYDVPSMLSVVSYDKRALVYSKAQN